MNISPNLKRQFRISTDFGPDIVAFIVLLHGILIVGFTLINQLATKHLVRINDVSVDISLAVGLSLIYLSGLLRRRKKTAWLATALAYTFYLGVNLEALGDMVNSHHLSFLPIFRAIILPGAILLLLVLNQRKYVVRSDGPGFQAAIRLSLIIIIVTFVYGATGFYLLGKADFHQRLSVPAAMHYSVDQLGLTTNHPIHAYTRRAKLFQDSLSFVSVAALIYVLLSLFQPLRSRYGDQSVAREHFKNLLEDQYDARSEDYFKLWPPDKQYFFDSTGASGLAYRVYRGNALVLGGPAGKQARFKQLLSEFQYVCYGNDWRPAIVHADDTYRELYEELGYSIQKLGQEAVLDLASFNSEKVNDKYFRNIVNKFNKQNYNVKLLSPPHHQAVIDRLKTVSEDWLSSGNRSERGYVMGYFTNSYVNQCEVMVAKDAAGTIQAFINLVPADFDSQEATYDMLRYSRSAIGNVNDYLLINLSRELQERGYASLNLGLCPLAGIEPGDSNSGLVDSVMGFAFANGDRFYSFSGLYRFKNKYSPEWHDQYIAYQGGIRGISKVLNALVQTMRITAKPSIIHKH